MSTVRAPCPVCDRGPRDTAMSVTTDERGTVSHCHRCHYWRSEWQATCQCGRILQLVSDRDGTTGGQCECGENNAGRIERPVVLIRTTRTQPLDWSARAESIWRKTQPLRGSLGETYLTHRGCMLPPRDSHLRYLSGDGTYPPSLCAAITDAVTAQPLSLHFTRLASDGRGKAGTDRDKLLLGGHRKKGGVIRLWPDECVTYGLGIAEGIETALAAAHVHTPIWAAIDAGNLAGFPVLRGMDAITVYADHDDAGLRAAQSCARRWHLAGRDVRVRVPHVAGCDAADVVMRRIARIH